MLKSNSFKLIASFIVAFGLVITPLFALDDSNNKMNETGNNELSKSDQFKSIFVSKSEAKEHNNTIANNISSTGIANEVASPSVYGGNGL